MTLSLRQKTTRRTYRARVQRGVKWLNERFPGWVATIEVNKLDLGRGGYCILGQMLQGFWKALNLLGLTEYRAQSLGFNIREDSDTLGRDFSILTEIWIEAIAVQKSR